MVDTYQMPINEERLYQILKEHIKQKDCFTKEIQEILLAYKNSGGRQTRAQQIVEQLAKEVSMDELLQDRAYDILDIITNWCSPNMRVWDEGSLDLPQDGLYFEDDDTGIIFNHYSFCERVKHHMVKYGQIDYATATQKLNDSLLSKAPKTIIEVGFLTHELEYHWAMLLVHGDGYWTRGIPSDMNAFYDEYHSWEQEMTHTYQLKNSYEYCEKKKQ